MYLVRHFKYHITAEYLLELAEERNFLSWLAGLDIQYLVQLGQIEFVVLDACKQNAFPIKSTGGDRSRQIGLLCFLEEGSKVVLVPVTELCWPREVVRAEKSFSALSL